MAIKKESNNLGKMMVNKSVTYRQFKVQIPTPQI